MKEMSAIILLTFGYQICGILSVPLYKCQPLDLTRDLNAHIPLYPIQHYLENAVRRETIVNHMVQSTRNLDPFFVSYGKFSMIEHAGTHIDSPRHITKTEDIARTNDFINQVPMDKLTGEACVIDVPNHGLGDRDYRITIADIEQWETLHGPLHSNCIVVIRTGQYKYWDDALKYMGADSLQDLRHVNDKHWPDRLHWPGLDPSAAEWILKNRGLIAIGVDSLSIDAGNLLDYTNSVHTIVLGSNRIGIENLGNVEYLPNRGATIIALPLKLEGASGSPARVIAYGWQANDPCRLNHIEFNGASEKKLPLLVFSMLLFIILLK